MKELLDGFSVEELEAMIALQPEDSVGRLARIALAVKQAQPIKVEILDTDIDAVKSEFAKGMDRYSGTMLELAGREDNPAIQNFRSAMEGIGHIRRTLEETFGGLHGTHVEPDVLVECKAICDAICAAYRGTEPEKVIDLYQCSGCGAYWPDKISMCDCMEEGCKTFTRYRASLTRAPEAE